MTEIYMTKERRQFLRQQYGNDRKQFPDLFDALDDIDTLELDSANLIEAVKPLFDRHGPVFASKEWQAAWAKAAALAEEIAPFGCEHGIAEGDYCEPCNAAYKAAEMDPDNK